MGYNFLIEEIFVWNRYIDISIYIYYDLYSLFLGVSSGAVSVVMALDYETSTSHILSITVSDKGTPTPRTVELKLTVNVNPVNEDTPVFTMSGSYGTYSIVEDIAVGECFFLKHFQIQLYRKTSNRKQFWVMNLVFLKFR